MHLGSISIAFQYLTLSVDVFLRISEINVSEITVWKKVSCYGVVEMKHRQRPNRFILFPINKTEGARFECSSNSRLPILLQLANHPEKMLNIWI